MDNSRQIWVFLVVEDASGNLRVFLVIFVIFGYFLDILGHFGYFMAFFGYFEIYGYFQIF